MTTTPNTMSPVITFSTHAWSMEHGVISVALEMLARQILLMRAMRASSRPGNVEVDWDAGLCQFEFIGTSNQACERLVIRHFKGS